MIHPLRCTWLVALACALAGCTGNIHGGDGRNADPWQGQGPTAGSGANAPPMDGTPAAAASIQPGRVVAHRLNKVEYDNTIRDLIGSDLKPSQEFGFPDDNYVEGFDNNADSLTASPLLLEKYQSAVEAIVTRALDTAPANAAVRARIMLCDPSALGATECATRILTEFATRAFRRPATAAELTGYVALLATATSVGDGFEQGISAALQAILLSPKFLFRVEHNPAPGVVGLLNDYEVASRLSYFLWSSMPDAELMQQASAQALHVPDEIARQVTRMLQDPKAAALADNLAGEWLGARELVVKQITLADVSFDDALRSAMSSEATLFMHEMLTGDYAPQDLLSADFMFLNNRLATHYGLDASMLGDAFTKVSVTDANRGAGVLTQANFLTVSSQRDRTSPTRRGKWVSENVLCYVIPPPPPKIPELVPNDQAMPTSTRERLEAHRRKGSTCNGCHQYMDPLGLAFEHYDAVGRFRQTDLGAAIDTTGAVPLTNVAFDGVQSLSNALQADPRFTDCVVRKLMTYALGRSLSLNPQPGAELNDVAGLHDLSSRLGPSGRWSQLVELIAKSPAMTMKTGEL